ncbi:hypothetical protein IE53DRAFT_389448 [Violaceomyces palustris]|uniref:Uncharacterized protein n=1 Tax=Violaceomyces palustris TaxID=1673888 RepID=A0ACD0NR97_9BASI|nr:hypothetical protein IE53DRAFT_389448 [Violaceomyces palustris]
MSTLQGQSFNLEMVSKVLEQDSKKLICCTCGAQYSQEDPSKLFPPNSCIICLDERQYVAPGGQKWTNLEELEFGEGRLDFEMVPEPSEPCILRLKSFFSGGGGDGDGADLPSSPVRRGGWRDTVGIGQTPILVTTTKGILIWDCSALFTRNLASRILQLQQSSRLPFLGIFVSHPHFYNSSLTWAKALSTKVHISSLDKEWYLRGLCQVSDGLYSLVDTAREDFSPEERLDIQACSEHVVAWEGDVLEVVPGVKVLRCGGHFPGSSILVWDRDLTPGHDTTSQRAGDGNARRGGVALCSDTFMPCPDGKTFSFMWSYPNMIPLKPKDVEKIWQSVRPYPFQDVIGGWPGKAILGSSHEKLRISACNFVEMEGWDPTGFDFSYP